MTLGEVLSVMDENIAVEVYDRFPTRKLEPIAEYDGMQSIPEELNDCTVANITTSDIFSDVIQIIIKR
jgi:hypothetical protein